MPVHSETKPHKDSSNPVMALTKKIRFIVFYSWISSSFPRPPAKRAVALAMVNAFSQLGNVAGSYVWDLKEDGYRKSYGIVTAMFGLTILGCAIFRGMLVRLNKRLERGEFEAAGWDTQHMRGHGDVMGDTTEKTIGVVGSGSGTDEAAGISELRTRFRYLV